MPKIGETTKPYQLYNCDCFELFAKLSPKSVDLVLVDPPYGTTQCKWDSIIPLAEMWTWLGIICKKKCLTVFTSSQPFSTTLVSSNTKLFRYELIWEKERPSSPGVAKFRPLPYHESIMIFGPSGSTYNPIMTSGEPYKATTGNKNHGHGFGFKDGSRRYEVVNNGTRFPKSVLKFTTQRNNLHPTQKPVALMEYLIRTYSNPNDVVLDFAMGSGTTGVACGNLGRRFIGCDNDTEHGYFEIANKRIEEAYCA